MFKHVGGANKKVESSRPLECHKASFSSKASIAFIIGIQSQEEYVHSSRTLMFGSHIAKTCSLIA